MDSLDWSDQHDELFSSFGQLMFEMQALERSLAIELGMVCGPGPATVTREQARSLVESYFTKTLGTLKNLISGVAEFPDTLKARLNEAVTIRNFIAHHYFWERSKEIKTEEGRGAMIRELQEHRQLFSELDAEVFAIYKQWLRDHGIADDEIEATSSRVREP